MPDLGQSLCFCAIPALCAAAATDMCSRKVPNSLSLAVAVAGLAAHAAAGGLLASVLFAASTFAFLYLLWCRGLLGGGDMKLLSACVLLVPSGAVAVLLAAVSISGGLLALAYSVLRFSAPAHRSQSVLPHHSLDRLFRVEAWRMRRGGPLPYACAISTGCVFTLFAG